MGRQEEDVNDELEIHAVMLGWFERPHLGVFVQQVIHIVHVHIRIAPEHQAA